MLVYRRVPLIVLAKPGRVKNATYLPPFFREPETTTIESSCGCFFFGFSPWEALEALELHVGHFTPRPLVCFRYFYEVILEVITYNGILSPPRPNFQTFWEPLGKTILKETRKV